MLGILLACTPTLMTWQFVMCRDKVALHWKSSTGREIIWNIFQFLLDIHQILSLTNLTREPMSLFFYYLVLVLILLSVVFLLLKKPWSTLSHGCSQWVMWHLSENRTRLHLFQSEYSRSILRLPHRIALLPVWIRLYALHNESALWMM